MTWRATVLEWTARLLLTSLTECTDWEEIDLEERFEPDRLAGAIDWEEIDVYDYVDPDDHLAGPVDRLHQLEDDPAQIYLWQVESIEAERQLSRVIQDEYRREYGHEPEAAHFVLHDVEQVREFSPDELQLYLEAQGGEA
jgi:hypothetical protein